MKMSVLIGCLLAGLPRAYAFVPSISSSIGGTPGRLVVAGIDVTADRRTTGHQRQQQLAAAASMEVDEQQSMGIVAPLTYIRGCPIVCLDFGLNTLDFFLSSGSFYSRDQEVAEEELGLILVVCWFTLIAQLSSRLRETNTRKSSAVGR
jgi:hypothetical protein